MALGGVIRDLVVMLGSPDLLGLGFAGPASGYVVVYVIELLLMVVTIVVMAPLIRRDGSHVMARA